MKLLTKDTDYAVRALIVLALHSDKYISAKVIAQQQSIPYQFLRGIVQKLVKKGFAESKEGAYGGIKLIITPNQIKITDIINIFQGEIELSDCMFRKKICANRSTCVLRPEIKRIENIVYTEFEKLTIQQLVDKLEG